MSNRRIMLNPRLFRWAFAFVLIGAGLTALLACGSADEPTRERGSRDPTNTPRATARGADEPAPTRESRTSSTQRLRESTPVPTASSRRATPTRVQSPAPTKAPTPTRAPTATPVPEGWVLTQSEPLHRAAYSGGTEDVEKLLDQGAAIEAQASMRNSKLAIEAPSLTPLHLAAAFNSNLEVAELLLEWGANVEAQDYHGRTPLHWAAWNAEPESVEQLLEWGANVEATAPSYNIAYNWRPLHFAAAHNPDTAMVELLLEWGADAMAYDSHRATALHQAVQYNPNTAVVELLLEQGANSKATNNNGQTPCQVARQQGSFTGTPLLGRLCRP